MTPVQRLQCVLEDRLPDRPPVCFWHHFPPEQAFGEAAVRAHLQHLRTYDLDFLKVMNDNGYPHHAPVRSVEDLASLGELRGDEQEFARQLDLLSRLKAELNGQIWLTTTIFNAWAVLRHLVRPPTEHNPPEMDASADAPSRQIKAFLADDPQAVRRALSVIGANLARFAGRCLDAGADGIFLSVRDDWVDLPGQGALYAQLVRPADMEILAAASAGRLNMLHVCGKPVHFNALAEYPVHAISWADRAAGPSISASANWVKPALCAGVDNLSTLPAGSPEDVQREVADAIAQAAPRPLIVAPGCTYDPRRVPAENLRALARAAQEYRYPPARKPIA